MGIPSQTRFEDDVFLLFLDGLTLVQHDFDVDLCSQSQSQGFRRKW